MDYKIITAYIQLKAFARQDGAILALVWIASFAAMVYIPGSAWGNLLAIMSPIVVLWRLISYRNYALEGVISFRRAYVYSASCFFYASLIFALVQYLFFKFLDNGVISSMFNESLKMLTPMYEQQGISSKEINAAADMISSMKPVELAFSFMIQNMFIGAIFSLPIAAVGMMKGFFQKRR